MSASTEHTLASLIDTYAETIRTYAFEPTIDNSRRIDAARAALLAYLAAHYVRRKEIASRDDRHNY